MKNLVRTMRGGVLVACLLLSIGVVGGMARIATAGLIILVLTPFVRVVMLTQIFARERDWPFAAISFGVLLLLVMSMILAA